MAMDFLIQRSKLDRERSPQEIVSLWGEHAELMRLTVAHDSAIFRRLHDYYRDATFSVEELPDLRSECQRLREHCAADGELTKFLRELAELAARASSEGCSIIAVAD